MTLPYYPRYTRAFLDATAGWPLELKGAYSILLDLIYQHGGGLPDDPHFIAGNLGCSVRKWNQIRADLIERGKLILRLSEDNLGIISNKRADKEAEKLRKYENKQRENGSKAHENKWIASATATPIGGAKGAPAHSPAGGENKDIDKEEEGARAREANSGFSEDQPPADPPPPAIPPGLLDDVRSALGVQPHTAGPYWSDPSLTGHVLAWIDLGLSPERIVAECTASRARNPEPPDGPKALNGWMAKAAASVRSADEARRLPARIEKPKKAPSTPDDRLTYFADLLNDPQRHVAPSLISNTLRDALLASGRVTQETMRERGIR